MLIMHEILTGELATVDGPLPVNAGHVLASKHTPMWWYPTRTTRAVRDAPTRLAFYDDLWDSMCSGESVQVDRRWLSAMDFLVSRSNGGVLRDGEGWRLAARLVRP